MKFKTVQPQRTRLADEVYHQLINAIMNQEIGPADSLIQEKIAADMHISRTPVREALLRLEQEGVLEVSSRGSFRLYQMDAQEIRELYQSRAAIEGQCARIVAVNHTQKDIDFLRATVQREEAVKDKTAKAYFDANRNIHRAFIELAGNRFLLEMFDMIWGKAMAFCLFAAIENVNLEDSLGSHMELVDIVATRDKTAALEAFIDHIQDGFDLQMKALASQVEGAQSK